MSVPIYTIAQPNATEDLLSKVQGRYATVLADPPWQFQNRTGKVAPEHRRLLRYPTMELQEIMDLPVARLSAAQSHLYLWVPNALLPEGLRVMELLLQERNGASALRRAREHAHASSRSYAGEHAEHAQEGTLAQA